MSLQYLYACIHRRTVPNHTLSATIPGLLRCLDPNKLMEFCGIFLHVFMSKTIDFFSQASMNWQKISRDFPISPYFAQATCFLKK